MVHSPRPTGCQIQLGSPDPLWEWHIPTDALFLSEGARRKLRLEKDVPPTMAAFAAHIPPDCLPSLHELLEGVLSGASGPMLELVYPFDDLLVRAGLLIVERNNEGRAVRGVGQYSVSETLAYRPSVTTGAVTPDTGYWQCSLTERTIRMDSRCCALLGYADPRPMVISPEQWRQRLHPEEGIASNCRYQLTLELPQWGDSIEDVLRIRLENGEYARFALHGTVLERDADGHARELAGSLQRIDATSAPARDSSQDAGRLLLAINAAGDGLWDWDAATDEVYYSPRYLSMLGYTAEQFAGDLETWKKKIHPDDIHKIVPPQAALVESPRYGDSFECTYRLMRADGTWAWILGRGYVTHRDAKGRATRLVGLHTDITTTPGRQGQAGRPGQKRRPHRPAQPHFFQYGSGAHRAEPYPPGERHRLRRQRAQTDQRLFGPRHRRHIVGGHGPAAAPLPAGHGLHRPHGRRRIHHSAPKLPRRNRPENPVRASTHL